MNPPLDLMNKIYLWTPMGLYLTLFLSPALAQRLMLFWTLSFLFYSKLFSIALLHLFYILLNLYNRISSQTVYCFVIYFLSQHYVSWIWAYFNVVWYFMSWIYDSVFIHSTVYACVSYFPFVCVAIIKSAGMS